MDPMKRPVCIPTLAVWMAVLGVWLIHLTAGPTGAATLTGLTRALKPMVGEGDAVMVASPNGAVLAEINAGQLLIPASILKVLTALAAIDTLGAEYRFATDFYYDKGKNLIIKGYGDPLLISERLETICKTLAEKIQSVEALLLDNSYFNRPILIPGRGRSTEPYDAPNGALCVNFNTVAFRRQDGQWVSDEPQTPLLPVVIPKIVASGLTSGRITLAADSQEALQYTGELFRHFLEKHGVAVRGGIGEASADPDSDRRVWRYLSETGLREVVAKLLEFSNNFIANQLLLSMGAHTHGPPATVEKGVRVLNTYYRNSLSIHGGAIVEASGISRQNRVSARNMMTVLEHFAPHYQLMRHNGRQYYKTGHLKGIRSRVGYLSSVQGDPYRFVVMVNTPGKSTHRIMRTIEHHLK
jgi:D-alanyl-D-alanine carboxypeptidase/D-alanyl-D-alanine-endopeptidase (penicillin-binding protein 4)